jgi:RNA polymerase sigma factor (sigma-70 family)
MSDEFAADMRNPSARPPAIAMGFDVEVEFADERRVFLLVYRQMRALCPRAGVDLDDLVQDAAEQVLRALPSFERRSKLSTWTYQICYRTLLKRQRSYTRWLKRFSFSRTGELPEPRSVFETDAAQEQEDAEVRIARLRAALDQVSPKRRAVVVMHDLEGMTSERIAEIIDAKLGTVRSRLRDGRKDLLRLLSQDPFFGPHAKVIDDGEDTLAPETEGARS